MTDELDDEILREHLDECLRHFAQRLLERAPKGSREAGMVKKPLAEFCGVSVDSVSRWLSGRIFPIGEQYFKLACFLDMVGYRVMELEEMKLNKRNLAELVGYGVLTGHELAKALGYTKTSSLYCFLQDHQGMSSEKNEKGWYLSKTKSEDMRNKKDEARRLYGSGIPDSQKAKTAPVVGSPEV